MKSDGNSRLGSVARWMDAGTGEGGCREQGRARRRLCASRKAVTRGCAASPMGSDSGVGIHHEPDSTTCACGCQMKCIGEDVAEKLDYTPGMSPSCI